MTNRPNPKDVNPYGSKARKRIRKKRKRPDPKHVSPYNANRNNTDFAD